MAKEQQSPRPAKNALQNLPGNMSVGQLVSVKPTGRIPNLSTSGDSGRDQTAYPCHHLLPYLSLQEVGLDLEVAVLLMNHVAVHQC